MLWRPVSVYGYLTRLETTLTITVTLVSIRPVNFCSMASSELSLAMSQPFWHADPSTEHTRTPKHTHARCCVKCVMQDVVVWCIMWPIYGDPKCGVEYMECGVMWNGMWNGMWDVAWCICGCDLKYGIAKWHNMLREVLVWYESVIWWRMMVWHGMWCGLEYVRDGVWCGMMQCKMWWNDVMRCEMQWQCNGYTFHISPPQYRTPYHISIPPDHKVWNSVEFGAMCNILQCQIWDAVPYSS